MEKLLVDTPFRDIPDTPGTIHIHVCRDGVKRAIKKRRISDAQAKNELLYWKRLKQITVHENLVHVCGVDTVPKENPRYIITTMQCVPYDSLDFLLDNHKTWHGKRFDWFDKMYLHIGAGLQHLHSMGIAHLDIKLDNVLISSLHVKEAVFKLADYGSVSDKLEFTPTIAYSKGTPHYYPPEMACTYVKLDSIAIDAWQFGITLLYMLKGHYFNDKTLQLWFEEFIEGKNILNLVDQYERVRNVEKSFDNAEYLKTRAASSRLMQIRPLLYFQSSKRVFPSF